MMKIANIITCIRIVLSVALLFSTALSPVFYVDVSQGAGEWTMIRMNVDDLEEAITFLEARGFHKARHEAAHDTVDTGSSRFNIMVSASG